MVFNTHQRYHFAYLGRPPSIVILGSDDLNKEHVEFGTPADSWLAFFYHHGNAVTVGPHTYPVDPGDAILLSPGTRVAHARVGASTQYSYLSFNLPATEGQRYALPVHVAGVERMLPDLHRAIDRIAEDRTPAIAFAWNLVCAIARNPSVVRGQVELYAAEAYILANLQNRFSIADVSRECGLSPRHLLRAFRAEHGMTVQEFIRGKRVQEAVRLLLNTNLQIKEVAARVGVPDLHYFNKLMREGAGTSPRKYRQLERDAR